VGPALAGQLAISVQDWAFKGKLAAYPTFSKTRLPTPGYRSMEGHLNPNRKPLRRSLVLAALLMALLVGVLWARSRTALTPTERKLVGSWIMDPSLTKLAPGSARVMTFASNRRVTMRDVANDSGAILGEVLGDKDETWFIDGHTLFIRRGRKGSPSLREVISGDVFNWDELPIASLSDNEIVIGNENWGHHLVLNRAVTSPHRPVFLSPLGDRQ
jgi:hypothetical protein